MLPTYAIYVINLDRSTDRLKKITQSINNAGLTFTRIQAEDGTKINQADHSSNSIYYQNMTSNEIACYLSHIKCWNQIIEDQVEFGIILEDDATLNPNFKTIIEKALIIAKSNHNHFIKLSSNKIKNKKQTNIARLSNEHNLIRLTPTPVFTNGQCISIKAAQELTNKCSTPILPIDVLFRHEWLYDFDIVNILPDMVRTAEGTKTTIGHRKSPKKPLRQLKKQWWKLKFHLKLYHYLFHKNRKHKSFLLNQNKNA